VLKWADFEGHRTRESSWGYQVKCEKERGQRRLQLGIFTPVPSCTTSTFGISPSELALIHPVACGACEITMGRASGTLTVQPHAGEKNHGWSSNHSLERDTAGPCARYIAFIRQAAKYRPRSAKLSPRDFISMATGTRFEVNKFQATASFANCAKIAAKWQISSVDLTQSVGLRIS
jgi:hypothetical protein